MPNGGMFPEISSSLRLRYAGLTQNQKSAILSITGGEPSLEVVKRHMRRISQPCGVEMRQDALLAKGDLLKAHPNLSRPGAMKHLLGTHR